ncbi:restriction endonuclease [Akkermansia sp.]|uniref:restriction endonuclease n=1 Tax=Akkermansia sp. TaxID=1872421 RepID=UPI0025C62323|nr:restriction endonuclease [Akkermansia sp.]MCC8149691.1 restriction endonuclease [Akkermansia sp.]
MSHLLDSVSLLLNESASPMHPRELTDLLIQRGMWSSQGKTPAATVSARIYDDMKKHGSQSRFVKVEGGLFALNPKADIKSTTAEHHAGKTATKRLPEKSDASYSFSDCAEKILLHFSGNVPMHYRDITNKALELGWLKTEGLTPEASMRARISTEIQRMEQQGRVPRFKRLGKGMIGLTSWESSGLEQQIDSHNEKKRKQLMEKVKTLSPLNFERLIALLLDNMGFSEVSRTPYGGDGGVDVRGIMTVHDAIHIKLAVQAKRWKANVQSPIVQQLRGSLGTDERGLIVTTSGFSKGAREEATRSSSHASIDLIDGEQLVSLLVEYNLGVRKNRYQLLELTPSFFTDEEEM